MIKRYGETKGLERWKLYCDRQAETNTFEYKNFRYGMTFEEFDKYNKKRGNPGERNGNYNKGYYQIWVEKYGIEIADAMNKECSKRKDNKSLAYMAKRYGEIEGTRKYDEFYAANSKRSLELILKNHGRCIYNSKSIPILIEYAEQHGYNIKHAENGGEQRILNYCVDGYDAENKIIIEFNERYHQNEKTKTKDLNRRRRILEHLGPGWKMIVIWYNKKIEIFKS